MIVVPNEVRLLHTSADCSVLHVPYPALHALQALMDNHQVELAEHLASMGHLVREMTVLLKKHVVFNT